MADLRELTTDAKRLYEAMDVLLAKQESEHTDDIDFKELWFSAKARPFQTHVLSTKEELLCKRYLTILAGAAALADNKEKRTIQVRFIARILAACSNCEMDIKELITDGMTLTEKGIDELTELADPEIQTCLLVDLLLLCYIDGDVDEKQLDFAIGWMAMFGLKRETAKAIGCAVKGILEQDDDAVIAQNGFLNVKNLYCYIKNLPDGILVSDIEQAKGIEAEKIIFTGVTWKAIPTIKCDAFKAQVIEFSKCTFDGIQGIVGKNKKVIIKNCIFKDSEVEQNFMTLKNATILDCRFTNISSLKSQNQHLFQLMDSRVEGCTFENDTITHMGAGGGLLKAKNCVISQCYFEEITTTLIGDNYYKNIVVIYGGRIFSCRFDKCELAGSSFLLTVFENAFFRDIFVQNFKCDYPWNNKESKYNSIDLSFDAIFKKIS
jgi:hypothetical protein